MIFKDTLNDDYEKVKRDLASINVEYQEKIEDVKMILNFRLKNYRIS